MANGKSNTDKSDNLVWHVTQVSHAGEIFTNLHVPWFYTGFEAIGNPFEKPVVFLWRRYGTF
jgi:hypothetical protein